MTIRGRGTDQNPHNRYAPLRSEADPDYQEIHQEEALIARQPATQVRQEQARSIISYNRSPDIGFDRSINPYRGCEHGCIYCFARPTHAYLDLSPGLDFETRLVAKTNTAALLRAELAKPGYLCRPIALGTNTDPYQPIESQYRLTRQILELLWEHRHPCSIVTKSQGVLDDLPLLAQMAQSGLARVAVSVTTLDDELKRRLEPRAASGRARLRIIRELSAAGVPVTVMAAPMIPALNDSELESIIESAHGAGADSAAYIPLRLPLEVAPLFEEWLRNHFPLRAEHVLSLIRQSRGGRLNDPRFHTRMRGSGVFADLMATRFRRISQRLGLGAERAPLRCDLFRVPGQTTQMSLW
jgi:DNA repair photolyase